LSFNGENSALFIEVENKNSLNVLMFFDWFYLLEENMVFGGDLPNSFLF